MVSISVKVLNMVKQVLNNLALGRVNFTGLLSHIEGYITKFLYHSMKLNSGRTI